MLGFIPFKEPEDPTELVFIFLIIIYSNVEKPSLTLLIISSLCSHGIDDDPGPHLERCRAFDRTARTSHCREVRSGGTAGDGSVPTDTAGGYGTGGQCRSAIQRFLCFRESCVIVEMDLHAAVSELIAVSRSFAKTIAKTHEPQYIRWIGKRCKAFSLYQSFLSISPTVPGGHHGSPLRSRAGWDWAFTLDDQALPHIKRLNLPQLQLLNFPLPAGGEESDGKGKGEGLWYLRGCCEWSKDDGHQRPQGGGGQGRETTWEQVCFPQGSVHGWLVS